ncbi:MAG: hypothetical protein AAB739_03910 [Patescibacteria group bacterium]
MKNLYCSHYFLNNTEPNRLIFKEQPTEGQNSPPAQKELKDLNEQVKEGNPLALERVLALEDFRKGILKGDESYWGTTDVSTHFEGDDWAKTERASNKVFQYLYGKLDEFFKKNTSVEWPTNRQKEWMDRVVDRMLILTRGGGAKILEKFDSIDHIDENFPSSIIDGYYSNRWTPGVGTFPSWFLKNYPNEYQKTFK